MHCNNLTGLTDFNVRLLNVNQSIKVCTNALVTHSQAVIPLLALVTGYLCK